MVYMWNQELAIVGPRGLMDKASDFESEDCEFESRRGRIIIFTWQQSAMEIV